MKTGHSSQIAVTDNATFSARDIDMSTRVGLTSQELDEREERQLLKRVLAQFDRRAIHDHMHEETLYFMIRSLHELRVNVQALGVSTIRDKSIRMLLRQIQDDIREMEALSILVSREAPESGGGDYSILDLRAFCGRWDDHNSPNWRKEANYEVVASQRLQSRLGEVRRFLRGRVGSGRVGHFREINTERLEKDMLCIYIFGAIDELKARIVGMLDLVDAQMI